MKEYDLPELLRMLQNNELKGLITTDNIKKVIY